MAKQLSKKEEIQAFEAFIAIIGRNGEENTYFGPLVHFANEIVFNIKNDFGAMIGWIREKN